MQKILSIGSKQFLSGIAPSAHTENGGLFLSANGVTPLYDAGGTASAENGLLQAGNVGTTFQEGIADAIICGRENVISTVPYLWMMGAAGHFYVKVVGATDVTDRAATNVIANPANGLEIWGPSAGTTLLYYWQKTQIGTFNMTGNNHPASPDANWTDNVYTGLTSTTNHPTHQFSGNIYYGNDNYIGSITDDGSATPVHVATSFRLPKRMKVTAVTDDGTYLVIAATTNSAGYNTFSENIIYFWDTISSTFTRAFEIRDKYVYSLVKISGTVYAFGQYGIYEVTLAGVKKILSRNIGLGTENDLNLGYGANRAISYNGSALLFATDTTVDTFGKLSPDSPAAYFKHFKIPTGRATFVSAALDAGRVYVGTASAAPRLYAFDFNGTTRGTGVSAQTVYFPFPMEYSISHIDVIFGEPLASGDSVSIQLKKDEDTAVTPTTALPATYADDGAIRRKRMKVINFTVEDQLSLVVNFVGGAVKIKRIDVFGAPKPI